MLRVIQFNRYEQHAQRISERDFAESLVVYAGYNSKKRVRVLKRVKKAFKDKRIVRPKLCRTRIKFVIYWAHSPLCLFGQVCSSSPFHVSYRSLVFT